MFCFIKNVTIPIFVFSSSLALARQIHIQEAPRKTEVQVNICENEAGLYQKMPKLTLIQTETSIFVETNDYKLYNSGWVMKISYFDTSKDVTVTLKHNQDLNFENMLRPLTGISSLKKDLKCEYDLHGAVTKLACKLKNQISFSNYENILSSKNLDDLLNSDQKRWFYSEQGTALPAHLEVTTSFKDYEYELEDSNLSPMTLNISRSAKSEEFNEASVRVDSDRTLPEQKKLLATLKSYNLILCKDQAAHNTLEKLQSYFH